MIKLIALDLDGTLIAHQHKISDNNRKAIKKCIDKGVMVSIHTGRCAASAMETIKDLDLKGYHSASSGAALINENMQLCHTKKMPQELVREFFLVCRELKIPFLGMTDDSLIKYEMQKQYLNYIIDSISFYRNVPDMTVDDIIKNTLQITIYLDEEDPKNIHLKDRFGQTLKFRRSGKIFLNIIDNSAGKLTGLKQVMELAGLKRDELMAVGDTEIDLGIINFAGTGVAMGNSPEAVKKAADFISTTCEEDGVAHAIEKFILN